METELAIHRLTHSRPSNPSQSAPTQRGLAVPSLMRRAAGASCRAIILWYYFHVACFAGIFTVHRKRSLIRRSYSCSTSLVVPDLDFPSTLRGNLSMCTNAWRSFVRPMLGRSTPYQYLCLTLTSTQMAKRWPFLVSFKSYRVLSPKQEPFLQRYCLRVVEREQFSPSPHFVTRFEPVVHHLLRPQNCLLQSKCSRPSIPQ
jgi:hypothetical protein